MPLSKIFEKLGRHPRFLQLYEVIDDGDDIYYFQEYFKSIELFDHIVQNQK